MPEVGRESSNTLAPGIVVDLRGRVGFEGSGDDRLSRQRHYHGPDGLNGRVRNGNGCDPASMVAGNAAGGRSSRRLRRSDGRSVTASQFAMRRGSGVCISRPVDPRSDRGRLPAFVGTGHFSPRFVGRLVRARRRIGVVKRSAVRTGRLRRSPAVHSRPIDLVVFQEPSHLKCWKPRLEEGFALRCLQRLSFPDLATRRCPERDSRHTRGRSSPILSY